MRRRRAGHVLVQGPPHEPVLEDRRAGGVVTRTAVVPEAAEETPQVRPAGREVDVDGAARLTIPREDDPAPAHVEVQRPGRPDALGVAAGMDTHPALRSTDRARTDLVRSAPLAEDVGDPIAPDRRPRDVRFPRDDDPQRALARVAAEPAHPKSAAARVDGDGAAVGPRADVGVKRAVVPPRDAAQREGPAAAAGHEPKAPLADALGAPDQPAAVPAHMRGIGDVAGDQALAARGLGYAGRDARRQQRHHRCSSHHPIILLRRWVGSAFPGGLSSPRSKPMIPSVRTARGISAHP